MTLLMRNGRRMRLPRLFALPLLMAAGALAQGVQTAEAAKAATLKPPKGAKVAIVVFEDLQCPDCGRAHPLVNEIARQHNIPVVHYDFPLPMHNWAFDAAVIRRYFESKSKELGEGWRDYVYRNQTALTSQNLSEHARKFAEAHGAQLPFLLDPEKKFTAQVKADYALGQKIGVQHTPTIWVVGATKGTPNEPFVEVVDRSQLSRMVDDMKQAAATAPVRTPARRKATSKKS
jgi:protein-disulfide isomerase